MRAGQEGRGAGGEGAHAGAVARARGYKCARGGGARVGVETFAALEGDAERLADARDLLGRRRLPLDHRVLQHLLVLRHGGVLGAAAPLGGCNLEEALQTRHLVAVALLALVAREDPLLGVQGGRGGEREGTGAERRGAGRGGGGGARRGR